MQGGQFAVWQGNTLSPSAQNALDGALGLDYADQRYYASTYGRFSTPDPYQSQRWPERSGQLEPVFICEGDPINANDRQGLAANICLAIGDDYDPDGFDAGCVDLLAGGPNGNGCSNIYTFEGGSTMNCMVFVGSPVFTLLFVRLAAPANMLDIVGGKTSRWNSRGARR